jgi:hypothetical protein
VGLDGWRLSIPFWQENSLDVVWGTACSLLAGVAGPQRHPGVLLVREVCVIFAGGALTAALHKTIRRAPREAWKVFGVAFDKSEGHPVLISTTSMKYEPNLKARATRERCKWLDQRATVPLNALR